MYHYSYGYDLKANPQILACLVSLILICYFFTLTEVYVECAGNLIYLCSNIRKGMYTNLKGLYLIQVKIHS